MMSLSMMRKSCECLISENEELEIQVQKKKERGEQWKMLSELFLEEINKAKERYGCK